MNPTLPDAWRDTVRRHPSRIALIETATGSQFTFQQMENRADAWAREHGPSIASLRGGCVLFSEPNGIRWFDLVLGLLKLGAIPVPLDSAEPVESQKRLANALRAAARWEGGRLVPPEMNNRPPRRFLRAEDCLIKLTSGSTGAPRPLLFSHTQLIADATQVMSTMGITRKDLNYALIPFGHSYGLGNLSLPLIIAGVPVVCGTSPLPHAIAADFAMWKPTVFPSVPAILRALVSTDGITLRSLRLAISAGAPLPVETALAFRGRFGQCIHSFYGSSETGGISYDRDGLATLEGSVGSAMEGVTLSLIGRDLLKVSSPAVITAGNRRRQGNHGAWVMADRVQIGADRLVRIIGRRGTMVKVSGRRVELTEVAAALRRLPGVEEAWVGVGGEPEPVLAAAVASKRSIPELRQALSSELPGWKVPKKWLVLPALPQTERGKTDTRALTAAIFPKAKRSMASYQQGHTSS